jgi:hypothetical protein
MITTYKIVRLFKNSDARRTMKTGLSLEQAQTHCRDRETSSSTATGKTQTALTRRSGPWFDAYEEEQ